MQCAFVEVNAAVRDSSSFPSLSVLSLVRSGAWAAEGFNSNYFVFEKFHSSYSNAIYLQKAKNLGF